MTTHQVTHNPSLTTGPSQSPGESGTFHVVGGRPHPWRSAMPSGSSRDRRRDCVTGSGAVSSLTLQTEARSGELPLVGSVGVWRSTRLRFALSGPYGG